MVHLESHDLKQPHQLVACPLGEVPTRERFGEYTTDKNDFFKANDALQCQAVRACLLALGL